MPRRGGGGGEGRHARGDRPGDAQRVEPADLLGDGAVERRIAGVDAGDVVAGGMGGRDLGDDLVEVERGRVDDAGAGRRLGHDTSPGPASRHRGRPGSGGSGSSPRTVMRSGAPGPAPMKWTVIGTA